jgi:hypothetical protein
VAPACRYAVRSRGAGLICGVVPLGYRVEGRALHVVEEHADLVRDIFGRYLEVGAVVPLKAALDQENVRLPIRVNGSGKKMGGGHNSRGISGQTWVYSPQVTRSSKRC